MNAAQIKGMRMMAETMETPVVRDTKTAREMAEIPHDLSGNGRFATVKATGRRYIWDDRFLQWASW